MRRRNLDWVIQPACWDGTQSPYLLQPDDGTAGYSNGEILFLPLTFWAGSTGAAPGSVPFEGIPEGEQTVERVRGTVHWGLGLQDPDAPITWRRSVRFEMRIIVTEQENFLTTPLAETETQYDTGSSVVANDDFLWNEVHFGMFDSNRWDDSPDTTLWQTPQRTIVDVRVKRRLKPRQVLAFVAHATCPGGAVPITGAPVNAVNVNAQMWMEPYLRTLVSTAS